MPDRANLRLYQGDDYAAQVEVTNGLPPAEVIQGFTARAQIRRDFAERTEEVLVDIQTAVESPYVYLAIQGDETASLCSGNYVWDLELTAPDGIVTTILAGAVIVRPEVTRDE